MSFILYNLALNLRDVVLKLSDTFISGTASAAEKIFSAFHPVSNNLSATGTAHWCQHGDGALKAVKGISLVIH